MTVRHRIMGGQVQIYKRPGAKYWQCSASVGKKQFRATTKRDDLKQAQDVAEEWFLSLRGMLKRGEIIREKTFKDAAELFLKEFPVLTEGQRSPVYLSGHDRRVRKYLIPFFGDMPLSTITSGHVTNYRVRRNEMAKELRGKLPARTTIHQEIVAFRQCLKTAMRHGWLKFLPDLSAPYNANGKVTHRAWFSPKEYRQLYLATGNRAAHPKKHYYKYEGEQLHDLVLFMANTGLRPDEVLRLEYRDVNIVKDNATGEFILEIEVRGKRGVGYCKSMPTAVAVFRRLKKRNNGKPNDKLFLSTQHVMFNNILEEEGLKFDREGQRRTLYSLRHTYICLRLMEGADIYQVAKNCRTSVEMIEKYYASHIKNRLDASAINIRRDKPFKKELEEAKRGELA